MSYRDIIRANCEQHSAVAWWPKFAFHYTDVSNTVNILSCGKLYSRTRAKSLGLMVNDNASRQVIDMTHTEAIASVRFYFRPLTPTQYHNEGFKHPDLRYDGDTNANVPVPVFLLFDLEKVLSMPGVMFSETVQSGYGSNLHDGEEAFARFRFDRIYSTGYAPNFDETKKYRHAEMLFPNEFGIDSSINAILCRNNIERTTLLNCIKEIDLKAYHKYRSIIKVCKKDMFENNALFIRACQYHAGVVSITFSDIYNRMRYAKRVMERQGITTLRPMMGRLELVWGNARSICYRTAIESPVDYAKTGTIQFRNLPKVPLAKTLQIRYFVEDRLMCFVEQTLEAAELIK